MGVQSLRQLMLLIVSEANPGAECLFRKRALSTDPESGVEFPKGYMCVNDPNKWGWQCKISPTGEFKFSKTKGSGGLRKRDAVCE